MSPKNQLLAIQEKANREVAHAENTAKKEYAKLLKVAADFLEGLPLAVIYRFNAEPALEPILKTLYLTPVVEIPDAIKIPDDVRIPDRIKIPKSKAPKGVVGKRAPRGQQAEQVLKTLASGGKKTAEIAAAIAYKGANLSAVLAGMAKAKKIKKSGGEWFKA